MESKNIAELILKMIMSLFVAVSVFLLAVSVELGLGFMNPESVRKSIVESGYVKNITDRMQQDIDSIVAESGIPFSVMNQLIDKEKMYIIVDNSIKNGLEGKKTEQTSEEIKQFEENLYEGIEAYLKELGIEVTSESKESTRIIASEISAVVAKYAKHKMPSYYIELSRACNKMLKKIAILSGIILALSVVVLILMSKYRHHAVRKIMYGISTAFIMNVLFIGYIHVIYDRVHKISFYEYYEDFLQDYLENSLIIWYIISVVLLCIIVGLGIRVRSLKDNY